jgi:hypothetical protein
MVTRQRSRHRVARSYGSETAPRRGHRSDRVGPMRGILLAALLGVIVWTAVIVGLVYAVNALR